ncbi:gamma-glutamyltransferase family protein [Leptospira interrogans]
MRHRPVVSGSRHVVSAGHHLAAQAAFSVLENGGNAVDAGVAAVVTLAVVQPDMVNVAGVAPMMIYLAERQETITISGLGVWPKAASVDYFKNNHDGQIPEGILRSVVPGAPDAWLTALELYGTMSFREVAAEAIRFARTGFATHALMSDRIKEYLPGYQRYPSNAAIYLANGRPPEPGEPFVQTDLGASLQYMVDEELSASRQGRAAGLQAARKAFYQGDIARKIDAYSVANGGLLRYSDLAEFRVTVEPPLSATYKGMEVKTCGPWCQGPLLIQILKMAEQSDLASLGHNSAEYIHRFAEIIKLAFADREHYYGDPKHVDVPITQLISEAYAKARLSLVDFARAAPEMPPAGEPASCGAQVLNPRPQPKAWPLPAGMVNEPVLADTSYACVVDRHGNVFSGTPSDASWDGVVIPGTGLTPSTRGCQSRVDPAHPSSVAPGKRPRLTPNPTIIFKDGQPILPIGTPGGDVQVQAMAQVFLNIFEFGMDVQSAVEAPRFMSQSFPNSFAPHQYYPGRLNLEPRLGRKLGDALAARGHVVYWWPDWFWRLGSVCTINIDREHGLMHAGADPRQESYAIGW